MSAHCCIKLDLLLILIPFFEQFKRRSNFISFQSSYKLYSFYSTCFHEALCSVKFIGWQNYAKNWCVTGYTKHVRNVRINPLNAELNPICYLLALLGAHHFLHVSRIRVKSLTLRLLMSYVYIYIYIYGTPILDVSRSHTTTQHSR